jgi:hypothetical protein
MALEKSVVNDQVFPLDPTEIAQAGAPDFDNCPILSAAKIADPMRRPLRPRLSETSSAAVATMNSRRFIRSSSQPEDVGTE